MNWKSRLEKLEKEVFRLNAEENLIIIFHDVHKKRIEIQASETKMYKNCEYEKAIAQFEKETGIDISKSGSILVRISKLSDDYPELAALKKRIEGKKDLDSDV